MITSCKVLLAYGREQAIPAAVGTTIKPNPVVDRVTDNAVELKTATVPTDSKIVFRVLKFLYPSFDLWFLSLKYVIISLMLLIELKKLLK